MANTDIYVTGAPTPQRTDVSTGEYALVMYDEGETLYQYEQPVDWKDPKWIQKQEFEHDEVPPLDLEQARLYREHNGSALAVVTVYATDISSTGRSQSSGDDDDEDSRNSQSSSDDSGDDQNSRRGYWVRLSDGTEIPNERGHQQQKDNMVAVVNYLATECNLMDAITLPYAPSWARTNCSINDTKEHLDGSKMRGGEQLKTGEYLFTGLNKKSKKHRLNDLAKRVDVDIDFKGRWEN